MDLHPSDVTTDEEIDEAIARAAAFESFPRIAEVIFRPESELNLLMIRLTDGRRLLLPREEISELKGASVSQIADYQIDVHGLHIWWPQLDDGIYLPNLLQAKIEQKAA